jgi:DNA-binding IscR family transcriptional regulator
MSHDMKLTKATNNALHTMLLLAVDSPDKHIGVAKLAERQEVSMTYLSKNDCLLSI